MLAVVDYHAGNLYSVCNSLSYLGIPHAVVNTPQGLAPCSGVILPGVGDFSHAMRSLTEMGLVDALKQCARQKPFLGICLGMQLLFEKGYESGETQGLALLKGEVRELRAPDLKVPHMGWNSVDVLHPCALTAGIGQGDFFYFVHSYAAVTGEDCVSLACTYGQMVPALVTDGGFVFGAQFHPEKSADKGLILLRNFWALACENAGA